MNKKLSKNIILFTVGFCLYITMEVLFRGYSFPLMGVCAGLVVVLLDKINDYISWDIDILVQCILGMLMVTIMELIIGTIFLDTNLLPVMWDYSNLPLNFRGIICIPFMALWMILSFIAILVADSINYYVFEEKPTPYYMLFGKKIIQYKEKVCKLHEE